MPSSEVKPRICHIVRGDAGYGFHLFGAKNSTGHSIRKVEENSPASRSGLLTGDKIVAVNGVNVQEFRHAQVVAEIKKIDNETTLLVIDEEGEKYCLDNDIAVTEEMVKEAAAVAETAIPTPPRKESLKEEVISEIAEDIAEDDQSSKPRPKLCKLVKQEGGYGFNLHSEKGSSGKTVSFVDPDGPAFVAGLKVNDRLVEVNGVNMENERHSKVVLSIKESGDSVELLVVDPSTDNYYMACHVTPSSEHLTGEVPTRTDFGSIRKASAGSRAETSDSTTEFTDAMLNMNLNALKAKVQSKRKQAPTTNWGDRKAIFNNF